MLKTTLLRHIFLVALAAIALRPLTSIAQESQASDELTSILVTATRAAGVAQHLEPNPVSEVGPEGLAVFGGPGQSSSFMALQMIPGVIADSADPYGLSFTRALNVRGKSDFFLDRTVNGLPVVGIVGGTDLFDLEDVQSESVLAGPILANQGLGVSNATGVLDQTLLGPREHWGVWASQDFGADDFRRSFARLDSGELATGTALFLSGSTSQADKWKGAGDAWRNNVAFGVSQRLADTVDMHLFYVYNAQKADSYEALTYAQTQNLSRYYYLDYYTDFATTPANARNQYYALNYQQFTDNAVLGNIAYHISPDDSLSLQSYYWKDQGVNDSASGQNIRYWPQNKDNYGAVLRYDGALTRSIRLSAGYWWQSMSPDPPPVSQQNYSVTPQGSLQFVSWATLGRFTHHEFNSPFIQATGTLSDTLITGGLRYLIESTPQMSYYLTKGLPAVPYDQVFQFNPALDPNGQSAVRHYYIFLPNAGLHRQLGRQWSLDLSYSRKVARVDYGPQASSFFGAESAFLSRGLTLQSLMGMLQPEVDDAVDLAFGFNSGHWSFTPDLYAYKAHHKEVLVEDPVISQAFYQSNASTTGYGIDLSAGYHFSEALTVFAGATISSETYDHNILIAGAHAPTTFFIGGKQVPNDPKKTIKAALMYKVAGFTIAPSVRFIGVRYGLANDSQHVPSFAVVDFAATYDLSRLLHVSEVTARLSVQNLFDRHYIDVISVNEDNLSSTSYYAGAPLTVAGSLAVRF